MNMQQLPDFYDIYDTWHVPWWQTQAFYYGLGFAALILLVGFVYYCVARCRAKRALLKPWDRALRVLRGLEKHMFIPEKSGEFYACITRTLKNYVHERQGFDVVGMTDQELLTFLAGVEFPKDILEHLRGIIKGGTVVKFANVQALQDQQARDLATGIMIIKQTIPRER